MTGLSALQNCRSWEIADCQLPIANFRFQSGAHPLPPDHSVELFLIKYGLVAVLLAALFEADVIPVLAGVAAHRGYFNPVIAVMCASLGAFVGDCVWFYVGRRNLIKNNQRLERIKSKAEALFQRVGHWQIPASHVIYGTRVATMIFLGTRGSEVESFVLVDGVSCLTLTTLLFYLGFAFSAGVSIILVDVRRVEVLLLATVVLCGLILHLSRRIGRRIVGMVATGERKS